MPRATLVELTSGLHGYLRFDGGLPILASIRDDPAQAAFVARGDALLPDLRRARRPAARAVGRDGAARPALHAGEVRSVRATQPRPFDVRTDYGRLRLSNSVVAAARRQRICCRSARRSRRWIARCAASSAAAVACAARPAVAGRRSAGGWPASRWRRCSISRTRPRTHRRRRLGRRLPVRGAGDELDEVAHAFNDTLARLEHAVGEMRQFSAALAHELRTPLAALRGEIELALMRRAIERRRSQRRLASQLEEIDRLKRLIDQLLTLARAEAGEIPLTRAAGRSRRRWRRRSSSSSSRSPRRRGIDASLRRRRSGRRRAAATRAGSSGCCSTCSTTRSSSPPRRPRRRARRARRGDRRASRSRDTGVGIAARGAPAHLRALLPRRSRRGRSSHGRRRARPEPGEVDRRAPRRHASRSSSEPGKGSTFTVRLPAGT